jgi:serine/threonine protein kinase
VMAVNRFKFKKMAVPSTSPATSAKKPSTQTSSEPSTPVWKKTSFSKDMELLERIGEGKWSSVFTCEAKKGRESPFSKAGKLAVKVVEKSRLNEHDRVGLRSEIAILRGITHPNIVRVFEVFSF